MCFANITAKPLRAVTFIWRQPLRQLLRKGSRCADGVARNRIGRAVHPFAYADSRSCKAGPPSAGSDEPQESPRIVARMFPDASRREVSPTNPRGPQLSNGDLYAAGRARSRFHLTFTYFLRLWVPTSAAKMLPMSSAAMPEADVPTSTLLRSEGAEMKQVSEPSLALAITM